MKKSLCLLLLGGLLVLPILHSPAGSETSILPSKSDLILKKLDEVLKNQKEIKDRLDRIEAAAGIKKP